MLIGIRAVHESLRLKSMSSKLVVIGLSGKKRSGKDSFFQLAEQCIRNLDGDYQVYRYAFADTLKDEMFTSLVGPTGLMSEEEYRSEESRDRLRPLWQWWGTEFRRGYFGEDYWTRQFEEYVKVLLEDLQYDKGYTYVVMVTDVRFPDEAAVIRNMGGKLVRIARPATEVPDAHASETALDTYPDWDYLVPNVHSLVEYGCAVEEVVKDVLGLEHRVRE